MSKTNLDYVSMFGVGSEIADGCITVSSHLKISGLVKMNIESAGKVVVTETGVVEGYIRALDVQIHGNVAGDVIAAEGLVIFKTGKVGGRVVSRTLSVEEGAFCNFEMAIGEEAISRRKSEIGKDDTDAKQKKSKLNKSSEKEKSDQSDQKKSATEKTVNNKIPDNSQESDLKSGKSAVDKEKSASRTDKVNEELPKDKDWVDRFW